MAEIIDNTIVRGKELALYGFIKSQRCSPEPAGVYYEARQIRDRLLFGEDCSDILSLSWSKITKSDSQSGFVVISRNSSDLNLEKGDNGSSSEDEALFDKEDKAYEKYLKNLNPTEFKDQDHYKVLGLSKMRYRCTENQIKFAYKKKVLNHHPDKRRQKGVAVKNTEEDYFTCISKAYETLSNMQKRRAYDSIDPLFDDTIPSGTLTFKENFFKIYDAAFERNERWSTVQPCPKLGDMNSSEDFVNKFYNFWYDFDSWREFSYLDEEDKEKGENRLERRWIDKQNKAARDKRRKDELKRLRTLVDSSYKNDPRVQKFKEEDKKKREDERVAKEEERRAKQDAIEREKREAQEKEESEKLRLEEEAKQKQLNEKREKDQLKKLLQKEKKALKELCQKYSYFCDPNDDSKILKYTEELDRVFQLFPVEKLRQMNCELSDVENEARKNSPKGDKGNSFVAGKLSPVFEKFLVELEEMLDLQRKQHLTAAASAGNKDSPDENGYAAVEWSPEENQLLIKAMTIFPVGTKSRWDVIAAFINEHSKSVDDKSSNKEAVRKKTGKDVVSKVKDVQKLDDKSKESVSKGMPLLQVKSNVQVETAPSIRTDNPADAGWENNPWTSQEQKLLEQALKTYRADDPDRWDKITACLPGRSKKDCVKRYKELAELVRARKVALQQQQQKQKADTTKTPV